MKKRALSLLMAFVMVLSLLPATARAANAPQEITDAAGLAAIADDPSGSYVLKNDIGSESKPVTVAITGTFTGTFDGAGHTVWLNILSGNNVGLFSKIGEGGTVKNVVTAGSVTGNNYVGGIAGVCEGTIRNCGNTAAVTGSKYVGGIAGQTTNGTTGRRIENCCNSGAVTATNKTPIGVGGLVGYSSALTLSNSCNSGTVTAGKADNKAGGLIGFSGSADKVTVSNSWWKKDCVTQKSGTVDRSFNGQLTESNNASYTDLQTAVAALNANRGSNAEWESKDGAPALKLGTSAPAATISGGDKLWMVNSGDQPYETIAVKLDGADDTGAAVTWSAAPEGVVTLADGQDAFHKIATACKPGKVTLTATVTAADGNEYPAVKEITVMPFINTIKIEGTPAVGKTVSARAYVFTGGPYEQTYDQIEGLPGLTYTWKKQTENNDYVEITGVTGDTLTITEELLGRSLWLSTRYNGEDKSSNTAFGPIVSAAEADVQEDASWLFGRLLPYTSAEQKADAVLPLTDTAEPHGSTITWTSSDETIIDPATGKLTLPETGEKPTVTLTAVLINGEKTLTRTYTITVWSKKDLADYDADLTRKLADDVNEKLGERDVLVPVCGTDTNVLEMVTAKLGREDITVTMGAPVRTNATANLSEDVVNIAADGTITYFYVDPNGDAMANLQRFGTFSVPFTFARDGATVTREVAVTVYWDRAKVLAAMEQEIVSGLPEVPATATENFELPKVVNDKTWTDIAWTSSDNAIYISTERQSSADKLLEPFVAVVRGSSVEKTVTLTAKLTFRYTNDVTGSEEPITILRNYTVTVPASAAGQKYQKALDAVFTADKLTDAATGAALDLDAVKNDIQFPTTGDLNTYLMAQYGEGFDGKYTPVLLTSSDAFTVREPDVANAARMAVYRPAVGEGARTVTLTVKILDRPSGEGRDYAAMPVLAEKTFTVTVQPLTEQEITNELALMAQAKEHYWDGIRGANDCAADVTADLTPFVEVYEKDGALVWVRDTKSMTNQGIVPAAMEGWELTEAWRLFRTSNPAAIAHETLLVTRQQEGKAVTVTSALSSETLGRYGELYQSDKTEYAAYAALADLYYQEVSASVVVRGYNAANLVEKEVTVNGKTETRLVSEAVAEKVSVTVTIAGLDGVSLSATTLRGLDEGTSAFDALVKLRDEGLLSFENKGSYIAAITIGGKTLGEFDKGPRSGWLYTVNGKMPDVSLSAYGLRDGDVVRLYYTEDYLLEPGMDAWNDGGSGTVTVPETGLPFDDVTATAWYVDAVRFVYEKGLMNGMADKTFAPNGTTTRAQIVTILYRLADSPAAGTADYSDVAADAWYADAVAWASGAGVVNGYEGGTFGPNDPVTREQLAAILYRYAVYRGTDVSVGEDTNILSYTDAESVSVYAIPAMQWAVGSGLVNGTDGGRLAPRESASRAQIAVILQRYCS